MSAQATAPAAAAPDKPPGPRDAWEKVDIVLKGLLPLAVAAVGYFGTSYLSARQRDEATTQFYTGLLARREEADSNLRKEMFRYVIDNFLGKPQEDMHKRVLGLRMLAANFHDSFDLAPLFKSVFDELRAMPDRAAAAALAKELLDTSYEIAQRQITSLAGQDHRWDFVIDSVDALKRGEQRSHELLRRRLTPLGAAAAGVPPATLVITASAVDVARQAVRLQVSVHRAGLGEAVVDQDMWITPFDFPALNSLRLPDRERLAITLHYFDGHHAELRVVHFPETRASLKDKPYFDDLVNELLGRRKG
jgi:hypothetical protein